jgi:hypothetical protein
MTRLLLIGGGVVLVASLGLWLWSRHGLAIWLDSAIAFCT